MDTMLTYFKTCGKSFINRLFERSIRVYIQKHLGEFLLGKLTTDQVDLGLDGGTLDSLYLNAENINERLENINVPFTVVTGYIDVLKLHIPWTKLSTESILVEVDGLMLTIKMKEEELDDVVDMKSLVESMTASMVEEVMKSEVATADAEKIAEAGKGASPFESVELMSELITSITKKIQIVLKKVLIRTEKIPGVCVDLHIEELDYFDKDSTTTKDKRSNVPPTPEGFLTKVVEIKDVRVNLEEVQSRESSPVPMDPQEQSMMAFDIAMSSPPVSGNYMQASMMQSFYPGATDTDPFSSDSQSTEDEGESIPILSINKTQTISIQIKNNDLLPGPSVNVSWNMESLHIFMSPKLLQLATIFLGSDEKQRTPKQMPMTSEDFEMCKNAYEEENKDCFFDGPNVPPLTMAKHMEMMHGGTADSVLAEEDVFYSTYQTVPRNTLSTFDISDSASVSTITANSTFSSPYGNPLSQVKKQRESASRQMSDNAVDTQNVNVTIPFFTVTLLLEDPEQSPLIPGTSSSAPNYRHPSSTKLSAEHKGNGHKSFSRFNEKTFSDHFHHLNINSGMPSMPFKTANFDHNSDDEDEEEEFYNCDGDHLKENTIPRADSNMHKSKHVKDGPDKTDGYKNPLQEVACTFFEQIALLEFRIPLHELRDKVAQLVPYDHLGLVAKPLQVNVVQEKKASESGLKAKVTFGKLEVIECLFGQLPPKSDFCKTSLPKLPQYSVLLTFDGNGLSEATTAMHEAFDMFDGGKGRLSQTALTVVFESAPTPVKRRRKDSVPHKLSLEFGKLTSEVDVTIIDRLSSILKSNGGGSSQTTQLVNDHYGQLDEAMIDENGSSQLNIDVNMKISHATLRVRFPIPDLRVDKVRSPEDDWYRRSLRKEVLVLEMEAPEAVTKIRPDPVWQLEVQIFKISAYLQEDINMDPVLFGEVTVDDSKASPRDVHHLDWPRLVVTMINKTVSELEIEPESDASGSSLDFIEITRPECSPFSHKKSMYEHDDLSFSSQARPVDDEMVMPGDATELNNFREKCRSHTSLSVDIAVPSITAFLHDKDFLELLYNRFNNDLLMWEPAPLRTGPNTNNIIPSNTSLNVHAMIKRQGKMTASFAAAGETSDSDDETEQEESMLYTIHDNIKPKSLPKQAVSKMCFSLEVGKGKLLAVIPHVMSKELWAQEQNLHGEVLITLNKGVLFSVNQPCGDPDLKYLSFHANRVQMYHNAHVTGPIQAGTLDHIRDKIPEHLNSRIYRSDRGAGESTQARAGWGEDSPHMLTVVVKTQIIDDTLNTIKNFTVAASINGGTLRHEMHHTGESWITQIIDLFDLKDIDILGYTMPKVMTELHLQLHQCCVDFRPLNLPIKSFLTVDRFSVCTNVIAESELSQIRLLFDKSALYLSETDRCNRDISYKEVHLFDDYVSVAEMDQLKIWLQFCYNKDPEKRKAPLSDLRFMCNRMNIQTCADSCKALFELIDYLINDGDLIFDVDDCSSSTLDEDFSSQLTVDQDDDSLVPSPVVPNPLTAAQEASVVSALEEAIEEVECPVQSMQEPDHHHGSGATRVYFHCDNGRDMNNEYGDAMHLTVNGSLDGSNYSSDDDRPEHMSDHLSENMNSLDDFEIVEDNFKEISSIEGSHKVQILSVEEIDIKEKFIRKPTSNYDHLRAPIGFPDPEHVYTLREISIVWRLFGGSDFAHLRRELVTDQNGPSKALSSPLSPRKRVSETSKDNRRGVKHKGGKGRDLQSLMELDLNKVRFRYEVYPTSKYQSSRFKFLVHNVEIRDRMKASEINKFLVKLIDKDHPEQSSVYMVMFSGVFTRPQYLTFREECQIKAFCLPIKLNVDQGSFNFLRKFISHVSGADSDLSSTTSGDRASPMTVHSSPRTSVSSTEPIMGVKENKEPSKNSAERTNMGGSERISVDGTEIMSMNGTHSTNMERTQRTSMDKNELLMEFNEFSMQQSTYFKKRLDEDEDHNAPQENLPVFIKSFILICDVTIKLDYRGKQCDMDQGVMGMMLGVASLTGSVITLKRVNCQKGILGWNKLLMYVANEWLTDIRTRQIHSILKGVGSFNILFQLVQGITDLVRLPIEQYQKDRRIIRGLQRGANSFTFNTLMALFELTHKIVGSIQYCAELGYDMMSPGPSVRRRKQLQLRYQQPRNTVEGAKAALQLVTDGAKDSVSNLTAIVSEEGAHKGTVGMVGATLRNAPQECLLKPIAIIAEAGTNIVKGMRNQVDPNKMKEEKDTWKQA